MPVGLYRSVFIIIVRLPAYLLSLRVVGGPRGRHVFRSEAFFYCYRGYIGQVCMFGVRG